MSADTPDEAEKPWNKPPTPEQADRLLKALRKRDPKAKNEPGKNPPKKD